MFRSIKRKINQRRGVATVLKNGFWFVDVPRTSSTSIRIELAKHFGAAYGKTNVIEKDQAVPQLLPDHMTAQTMRDLVGRTAWANLYSFAIVRNPWDRVFSLFNYLRKENDIPEEWSFSEFVEHMVTADENSAYLSFHALRFGSADFVTDETGSLIVTKIVRFENRQSELREVAQRLQLPELGTAHLQSASPTGADFRSAYDAKTRDLVGERFKLDIELFNYEF